MKLSKLKQPRPSTVPLDFGDGELDSLTYDRAVITTDWTKKESTRIERLSQLLISWTITDDSGKPYQPAANLNGERPAAWAALLSEIPPDVLRAVEDAIWDDYYAGKPLGGGSTAT
jgi:hypothetical protein